MSIILNGSDQYCTLTGGADNTEYDIHVTIGAAGASASVGWPAFAEDLDRSRRLQAAPGDKVYGVDWQIDSGTVFTDGVGDTDGDFFANLVDGAVLKMFALKATYGNQYLFTNYNQSDYINAEITAIDVYLAGGALVAAFDLTTPAASYTNGGRTLTVVNYVAAADTTAPTFSVAPAVTSITATGGTAGATIDETGDIYYVVVADAATAPTPAEVIAGTGSGGSGELAVGSALAGTVLSDAFSGLSASTAYDVYFVARDDEGTPNVQSSVTKVDFTTAAPAYAIDTPPATIEAGTNFDVVVSNPAVTPTSGNTEIKFVGDTGPAATWVGISGADPYTITANFPTTTAKQFDATGHALYVEVAVENTTTAAIPYTEPAGYDYTVLSSPNNVDAESILYGYAGTAPATNDQIVFENSTTGTVDDVADQAITVSVAVDGIVTFDGGGVITGDVVVGRYLIQADGTVGAEADYTYSFSAVNNAPTGTVTIAGTPEDQQTLTASNNLADADGLGTISYQWYADAVAISGATGSTYLLTTDEIGAAITVTASYTDALGTAESVTSSATTAVVGVAPGWSQSTISINVLEGTNTISTAAATGSQTLTYVDGGTDAALITTNSSTGTMTLTTGVFTAASKASYSLTRTASSSHGSDAVQTIILTVVTSLTSVLSSPLTGVGQTKLSLVNPLQSPLAT